MSKMSISDAAQYYGVSKEAIHNRIRRGSLESVIENGVKMVIVDGDVKTVPHPKARAVRAKSTTADDRYYKLLEEQNKQLQMRVEKLEDETKTLRDQKEAMLVEERIKIEQIYKEKDEQLKNVLHAITAKFMLVSPEPEILPEEHVDAEIEEVVEKPDNLISLKKYLKNQKFSKKKIEKIVKKFIKNSKGDNRVVISGKKCYIDTSKYDYSDLLNL